VPQSDTKRKRCAVYTRQSSEEGLEQEFNTLAAQRVCSSELVTGHRVGR
jgi:site-specific DNA recombinase